ELTVAENLALASKRGGTRTMAPLLRGAKRSQWRELLAQIGLGLEDRLDDPIGLLSGGQRQSITLLMATLTNPKVLLLDEHTAALDPRSAELVIALTTRLVARSSSTTLMVTHSMQQAATLGDRLIAMHRGGVYLDVSGPEKRQLTEQELLGLFSQMRRDDRFDAEACALVRAQYRPTRSGRLREDDRRRDRERRDRRSQTSGRWLDIHEQSQGTPEAATRCKAAMEFRPPVCRVARLAQVAESARGSSRKRGLVSRVRPCLRVRHGRVRSV
ncbi:MAG: hypothetical protein RJA16_1749, partial [Planctomycetota bacterium]